MVPTVQRFGLASGVAGILLLASAVAAQKLEVKTHQDPKANLSAIRTYAWLPPAPIVTNVAPDAVSNPSLSDEALRPHLIAAIDRQMAAHGLTKVDSDKADVHVTYFAALTTTFNQSYLGEHYGYITGWGSPIPSAYAPSTSVQVHEKGTVLVDLVDRAKKRAIWRATVVTRIAQEHTLEKRIERINEGAERIFQRFPIKAKK
jgi:Domain of unknown function (DUF4136)